MSTSNFEAILGPSEGFGSILGPSEGFDEILAEDQPLDPEQQADPADIQAYLAERERLRELQRQQFLIDMGQAPPSVVQPTAQAPQQAEDQDLLGVELPLSREDELLPAYQKIEEEQDKQLRSTTMSKRVQDKRMEDVRKNMLERRVTSDGVDIGNMFESDILLHTDGYVLGEDGAPRKASGLELLVQSMGRQTLYAGLDYEQRISELKAQKQERFQQALNEGKSRPEAYKDAESFFQNTLTEVDTERRQIRETFTGALFRNLGLGSALVGELLFDTLPLYYEVDADGELQNPDSMSDQFAYMMDNARSSLAETIGVTDEQMEGFGQAANLFTPLGVFYAPIGAASLAMGGDFLDVMPIPFKPIDRDQPTGAFQSNIRVAASTGGFFADVAMANSRGRWMHDELLSIPSYRERLGDNQWLSMGPAMLLEILSPGGPIHLAKIASKGAKFAALTGKFGLTAKNLAKSADPAKWAQAYRVTAELQDALGPDGVVDAGRLVREGDSPATVVTNKMANQLSTPVKMRTLLNTDGVTNAELTSFMDTDIGSLILSKAFDLGDFGKLQKEGFLTGQMASKAIGPETKAVVGQAIQDWRMGLEANTVARALRSMEADPTALKQVAKRIDSTLRDTVEGYKPGVYSLQYAKVYKLADDGAPIEDVIAAFKRAAAESGSAPIRSSNVRMRQLLAASDLAAARSAKSALQIDTPLQPYLRATKGMGKSTPDTVRFGSALENMWRDGLRELIDIHMPRNVKFVTDRLMVPSGQVNPKNMKQVGQYVRAIYNPTYKEGRYVFTPEGDVGKALAMRLQPVLDSVLPQGATARVLDMLVDEKGLSLKNHAFITDAIREAGWRKILKNDEAVSATMAGRTTRQASERLEFKEEVVRPVLDKIVGSLTMVNRAVTKTANMLPDSVASKSITETMLTHQKRWNTDLTKRWLMSTNKHAPQALKLVTEKLGNEVGLIKKRYRAAIARLAKEFRSQGKSKPGALAINEYSRLKWAALTERAVERFDKQVADLLSASKENARREPLRQTPTYAEAVARVLYDQLGITGEFRVGNFMESVRAMDKTAQGQFVEIARNLASRGEKRKQWSNLMRAFFSQKKTQKDVDVAARLDLINDHLSDAIVHDAGVREAMKMLRSKKTMQNVSARQEEMLEALGELSTGGILVPTSDNIQRVIDTLRKAIPDLEGRGAAVRSMKSMLRGDDATLRATQTWQMSADRQLATSRVVDDFIDQHPEFITTLSPNVSRQTEDFYQSREMLYQAPIATQNRVLDAVRRLEQETDALSGQKFDGTKGLFRKAREYVSNRRGVGRASVAEPALPTKFVRAGEAGEFVETMRPRGVMEPLTRWARQQIEGFGPTPRRNTAAGVFREMITDKTLYPNSRNLVGVSNKNQLVEAVDNVIKVARETSRRLTDPQSVYLHKAIKNLTGAGVAESLIKTRIMTAAEYGLSNAAVPFIENQVRNTMRRYGFSSFGTSGALDNLVMDMKNIPLDAMSMFPVPPGMAGALKDMRLAAADGTMIDALESLHSRSLFKDQKYGMWVLEQVADFIKATNQMAAYGLLSAGIVIGGPLGAMVGVPLARYIGLNVLSAPMMMVGTLGVKRAVDALSFVPGQVKAAAQTKLSRALPNTVAPRAPNSVVFRDLYGKEWTQKEFDDLCAAYNIFMSRAEVDATANIFKTMQRDLGIYAKKTKVDDQPWVKTIKKTGKVRQLASFIDPRREAVGMQFAMWTDNVFRRGAFAAAIRDGSTPMEAAKLARASVLDYGAVPDVVKNGLNRYLLFATFRAASTSEIIRSVFAGRDAWMKVLKLQMRMHQSAGAWTFGADHEKVRSFSVAGPSFDNRGSVIAGPQEVFSSGASDMINLTMFAAGGLAALGGAESAGGDWLGRLAKGVTEENIQPVAQALLAVMVHSRPTSRGRLVNDSWVVSFKQAGLWDEAVERFSIQEISDLQKRDERRPGAPEFDGVQYVFTGTGYRDFQVFSYLATVLTMNRASQDYAKSIGTSMYPPDGYDPKYRAIVPFYAYLPGAATPLRMKSPEDIHKRALRRDQYQ